ncbi:MAG: T9SS type A sorting domain-containing protein [Bacteroidales bacterium]|nr:T9SS type A sorting domain-containing protein [Bacteroidales bacterium]
MNRLRSIMLAVATVVCTTMMAQTPNAITQQLYWLDGDISSAQAVTSTVDISGLLPGLHSYSIRVKDSNGLWSSIVTKYFVIPYNEPTATAIAQREYWIDGNVAARTALGESPAVISIGSLSSGLHSLTVRVKDDAGRWSSAVTKYFIIPSATESSSVAIARYMYWIDGNVANCVTGNVTGSAIGIDFSALSEGTHTLSWRVSDTKGAWGMVKTETFTYSNLTAAGDWNVATNWNTGVVPAAGTDVTIAADITIPSDYVANAGNITIADGGSLTIADGGQLFCNNSVAATVKKSIADADAKDAKDHWYTISAPVHTDDYNYVTIGNETTVNLTNNGAYDMFAYEESTHTWLNQKEGNGATGFDKMYAGQGYMYRNSGNELSYVGNTTVGPVNIALSYTSTLDVEDLRGFNLIGNPYTHSIAKGSGKAIDNSKLSTGCYALTNSGTWTIIEDGAEIKPNQGILVEVSEAVADFQIKDINYVTPDPGKFKNDNIKFIVESSEYSDAAYAWFDKGIGLTKINHRNENAPMLYIPQDDNNYAIATMTDDTKVFGLNFKAATAGKYTLSYKATGDYNYLHVIDRLTGADVDMLLEGEYSFIGTPKDSENRFIVHLEYMPNYGEGDNDIFAYQSGSDIYVSGQGELQVFDITGRRVISTTINDAESISIPAQGVYIFKLNEKAQKIVVR